MESLIVRALVTPLSRFLLVGSLVSLSGCSDAPPTEAQGGSPGVPNNQAGSGGVASVAGTTGSSGAAGSSTAPTAGMGGASGGVSGHAGSATGGASVGMGGGGAGSVGSGGSAPAGACDKSMATWTDTDMPYASKDFGGSFLRKNFWNQKVDGAGTLTLWAASSRCWGVDATSVDAASSGTVKSYPDMARGWVVGTAGFQNPNSGLPILVSDLKKAKIRWKMTVTGSPMRQYALWDIYFHESAMPGRGAAPVNLMIKQRVVDPSGYEQDKESAGDAAVTHTFSGITFRENKNTGLKSGSRIVVELFATPVEGDNMGIDDMTLDLKEVIDYYVQDGSIKTTDYLTSIQTGWEVVAGGTFVTNDFWTALQDEPEPN
ncbi:MAG TPA: hypothetical protein VEQ59_14705 [Polyangiaceae bacterium]|nr:hypothetical protein [Polyangiaceae bacterium]